MSLVFLILALAPASGEPAVEPAAPGPSAGPEASAGLPVEPAAPPPPPPWEPTPEEARFVDRVPLLGPWPDGWLPEDDGQGGLPTIDVILHDVLDPGRPYGAGPVQGPAPDALAFSPLDAEAEAVSLALTPAAPEALHAVAEPAAEPGVAAAPAPPAPPSAAPAPHSAFELLPPPPERGLGRALLLGLLALGSLVAASAFERLLRRVPPMGLLPRTLSALTGGLRALFIPLLFLAVAALLPAGLGLAVPFALVALSLAMGWSARGLLADVFAGFILTVERRLRPGDRVELKGLGAGIVQSMGLRAVCLLRDDGLLLTVPNHRVAAGPLPVDPDPSAPVVVVLPAGPLRGGQDPLSLLQEIALLQPWLAPGRAPRVQREPGADGGWRVEARLIDPRHAPAFQLGLRQLWERELIPRRGGGEPA